MPKKKNRGDFNCVHCERSFKSEQALFDHHRDAHFVNSTENYELTEVEIGNSDTEPDWSGKCEVCEAIPIVPMTGMCGPCTWGEADTAGGNW